MIGKLPLIDNVNSLYIIVFIVGRIAQGGEQFVALRTNPPWGCVGPSAGSGPVC